MAKLKEDTIYTSGTKPKSSIIQSTYMNRLNSLFGYRTLNGAKPETEFEKQYRIKFVKVDLENSAYRIHNAAIGSVFNSAGLNSHLGKYFDAYLNDTEFSYSDIQDRQVRCNKLYYMWANSDFVMRCVQLVADEATQLDVQDRLISIESPNTNFVERTYQLLNQWGITQSRVNKVCWEIELYGESFWAHKVGLNGVEKITPIPVTDIIEKLEFSGADMAKYLSQRDGWQAQNKDRKSKLEKLINTLESNLAADEGENLADLFDKKLLGYELHDGIIVPPWLITHFKYGSESEFLPYGRPPLLGCLSHFQREYSTIVLQGLARLRSFPIMTYSVKATDGMLPGNAFDLVKEVRENYNNIGVEATSDSADAYAINTDVWMPEGLLQIDTVKPDIDLDSIGDLENYEEKLAISTGVPRGYIDQEFNGFGQSAISLTEQYKPFARHVYTIQAAFLQGLGELIRMHYAITGEFDYNTSFVLSMRFPAEEVSEDKRNAQQATMEMTQSIIELIKGVMGIDEEEPLPEDVVTDILSKYSFLDPTDIQKWMRLSSFLKSKSSSSGGDDGGDDFGGIDDVGGGEGDDSDMGAEDIDLPENLSATDRARFREEIELRKQKLRERNTRIKEAKLLRLKEVSERYKNCKDEIYMRFIESQHLQEWPSVRRGHSVYVPKLDENSTLWDSIKVLTEEREDPNTEGYSRIREEREFSAGLKLTKNGSSTEDSSMEERAIVNRKIREMIDSVK